MASVHSVSAEGLIHSIEFTTMHACSSVSVMCTM